jgi:hypothetical protein
MYFFLTPAVFDKLFYNLPVHERLAAEEIHFKVFASSGIDYQKSSACLPTSKLISDRSPLYLPWLAKQYSQLRLQVWRHAGTVP